jgi:hypothetical protein
MSSWAGFGDEKESVRPLRAIEVRWGLVEDEPGIADLLELNGKPRAMAFEERFVVAEEKEKLVAALQYRRYSKRLLLGLLIADPWTEEHPLAVALYAGAGKLVREMGGIEVLACPIPHADHPYEAGYYRWWGHGWWLDTSWPSRELPKGGWRRAAALLGILAVPFHRVFGN